MVSCRKNRKPKNGNGFFPDRTEFLICSRKSFNQTSAFLKAAFVSWKVAVAVVAAVEVAGVVAIVVVVVAAFDVIVVAVVVAVTTNVAHIVCCCGCC